MRLSEFQLVLPNFSFFLSLAWFFLPRATNFFFSVTNSKKNLTLKNKPFATNTRARVPHTLVNTQHTTPSVDELLLGDSFSHDRSLSACQLLSACLHSNLFRNFPQTSTSRVRAGLQPNPKSWLFAKFDDFRGTELKYTRDERETTRLSFTRN